MRFEDISKLKGIERVELGFSLIWVAVASVSYYQGLGHHYIGENRAAISAMPFPARIWFALSDIIPYDIQFDDKKLIDFTSFTMGFDLLGFLAYLLIPIVVLLVLFALVEWVVRGFHKTDQT